jgi:acyl-CoA synthetase (NDP forming)
MARESLASGTRLTLRSAMAKTGWRPFVGGQEAGRLTLPTSHSHFCTRRSLASPMPQRFSKGSPNTIIMQCMPNSKTSPLDVLSQMKLFMEPRSIAVVGATRQSGTDSFNIVERLGGHGYQGKIYPVNPKAEDILGIRAYPDVASVPERADLAVIPVWERSVVPSLIGQCIDAGIRAIVVVTQGFADGDEEGRQLQDRILTMAREGGARLLGPNSLGVANAFVGLNTSFVPHRMDKVPLGLVCQSGLFFSHLRSISTLGKGIDVANGCDIHFADALAYYEDDPQTKVIVLHIEGMRDARRFMETAKRVAKKKPIIALKAARTEEGARAAVSHTGSMSGSGAVFSSALKQCGVLQANNLEEMEDLARAFLRLPLMKGRRVGIVSMSGGAAVMLVDACGDHGLEVAELSPGTTAELQRLLPPWMKTAHPLDLWPISAHSGLTLSEVALAGLRSFLADPNVDGLVFAFGTVLIEDALRIADALPGLMRTYDKPVCWWTATGAEEEREAEIEKRGLPVFRSGGRAVGALRKLGDYWRFLQSC